MASILVEQNTLATWISNFVDNVKKLGKDKLSSQVIETRLELLETYWAKFLDRHFKIVTDVALSSSKYLSDDHYATVEKSYIDAKSYLRSTLATLTANQPSPVAATSMDMSSRDFGNTSGHLAPLKPISLPKFSGTHLEWETFKEMYTSLVHDDDTLSPVLKLQYLLSALEGDAAKRLKNIQVVASNYQVAWNTLVRRYDNKRIRLSFYMRSLIELAPASSCSVDEIMRLLDQAEASMRAFKTLNCPIEHWDAWTVNLVVNKLDHVTRQDWEQSLGESEEFPTYDHMKRFLETRVRAMEVACQLGAPSKTKTTGSRGRTTTLSNMAATSSFNDKPSCPLCRRHHWINGCTVFKQATLVRRKEIVAKHQLCLNCLRPGHRMADCPSTNRCRSCDGKHHTLLHHPKRTDLGASDQSEPSMTREPEVSRASPEASSVNAMTATMGDATLLATALVRLESERGDTMTVRALLDSGSESTFVTEHVVQSLRLSKIPVEVGVRGIGGEVAAVARSTVRLQVRSLRSDFAASTSAMVLSRLSGLAPKHWIPRQHWTHLQGLPLADPHYGTPARVDCILGADIYAQALRDGLRVAPMGHPTAQNTAFGWILLGRTAKESINPGRDTSSLHVTISDATADMLRQFWEIEEPPRRQLLSDDEKRCEQFFRSTMSRRASGRYIVRLPFRSTPIHFPGSRDIAIASYLRLEKRISKDRVQATAYRDFLEEYLRLGHMKPVSPKHVGDHQAYYMPHHAVHKRGAAPNQIRVVFNASQTDKTGRSLNDVLLPGPKLQQDLWLIITRWREFQFAFTSDVVKMYRQIDVHASDTNWQRIVWRSSPELPVSDYKLTTVTYGTTSAPFLALRVILQLTEDEGARFPQAAQILKHHMYVDDILAGGDTLEEAVNIRGELIDLMLTGGFQLSKWAANHPSLSPGTGATDVHSLPPVKSERLEDLKSTLGLRWNPADDTLSFNVKIRTTAPPVTKRGLLSELAQLFDPLGWLAPVTIVAKVLLQTVWLRGCDWDSNLPEDLAAQWSTFRADLHHVERLSIPRWFGTLSTVDWILHGFADASEKAYAAAAYRASQGHDASLIIAKTKVAPLKVVSVARLELCGALLLARVMRGILDRMLRPPVAIHCWTDSTTVLAWLQGQPAKWTTFVANRVSEIHTTLPEAIWHHTRGTDNPADFATRGLSSARLEQENSWWKGPLWLSAEHHRELDHGGQPFTTTDELKQKATALVSLPSVDEWNLLEKYSSLTTLYRVTSFCFRFINNCRTPASGRRNQSLQREELQHSKTYWWKFAQNHHFAEELDLLRRKQSVPQRSPLHRLTPFLDDKGVLRVGGRLDNSFLPYEEKHPVILPAKNALSRLIVLHSHKTTLHGGPQLTLSHILRSHWIIRGRNLVRSIVRQCVTCIRHKSATMTQQMAPLPRDRVTPARPFSRTGLDYAGPIFLRTTKGRGHKAYKGYVALFVCMSTRAVHLEAVTDLSSSSFLAAFHRFTSRRGLCDTLLSDNATTFRGADAELQRMFNAASTFYHDVANVLVNDGVKWSFIPPRAPHFGGIWESAVKSVKHHLRRIIGDTKLTYEEMSTLLARIEACLNSRPIAALSTNPMDVAALTPGHFLIGSAITAAPEADTSSNNHTMTSRWHLLNQMRTHFWHRWRKEYLSQLQARWKWPTKHPNICVGQLVIVKDELLPPTKWLLGRVTAVHPGRDGLIRSATLRTATADSLQRPVVKLIPLPINNQRSTTD